MELSIYYAHDVQPEGQQAQRVGPYEGNTLSCEALEQFLQSQAHAQPLSYQQLAAGDIPHETPSFMLSFDDGYRGNLQYALPILEAYKVPAMIFVTTGFIGNHEWPYEYELAQLIEQTDRLQIPEQKEAVLCDTFESKQALYLQLTSSLKSRDERTRREAVAKIAALNALSITRDDSLFLDWEELAILAQHPLITLGAHSVHHPDFKSSSSRTVYREILESKAALEQRCQQSVEALAYPYGGHNWRVRMLAKMAGIKTAFTTKRQVMNADSQLHWLQMPRMDIKRLQEPRDA